MNSRLCCGELNPFILGFSQIAADIVNSKPHGPSLIHVFEQYGYASNTYTQKQFSRFWMAILMACSVLLSDCCQLLPGEAYLNAKVLLKCLLELLTQ